MRKIFSFNLVTMKEASVFNSSNLSVRCEYNFFFLIEKLRKKVLVPVKFDSMSQNQGRTFGPIMGLLLVNLFAKAVLAKYDSYFPLHLPYDPSPWMPTYNKPLSNYNNYHSYYPHWYPVKNPYNYAPPSYQTYPTLTTAAPFVSSEQLPAGYENDYQDYSQDPNNYENLIPAESNNVQHLTTTVVPETTTAVLETTPITKEPETAESSFKAKRQPTQRYRKRGPTRRNKYPQKRRRTTTPAPEYYDSYEDYTERYQPNRRRRPPFNRQSSEQYYDEDDDYYSSFETTPRYFKRRRPTRRVNKIPNRNDESLEIETSTQGINPNTEIVIVRQATTTTSTTTSSTTTEPTTIITNTTMPTSTTEASNTTYGKKI